MVPALLVSTYVHPVLSTYVDFDYRNINYNSVIQPKKLLTAIRRAARVKYVFSECTESGLCSVSAHTHLGKREC